MNTLKNLLQTCSLALALLGGGYLHAQEKVNDELAKQVIGMWDFVIENVNEIVYLRIDKVTSQSDGVYALDAVYGWPSRERPVKSAELIHSGKETRLTLTAHNGGNAKAVRSDDGSFVGTWEYMSNPVRQVRIVKMAPGVDPSKTADAVIVRPGSEVPKSCAAFVGQWSGTWGYGIGQTWLWVASVDSKCLAKVAYLSYNAIPRTFEDVEIKGDTLEWLCNKSTQGTCRLSARDDELWANYSNPGGGSNSAVFKKLR